MNEFRRIAVSMYEVSMLLGIAAGLMQHASNGDYAALGKVAGLGAVFAIAVGLMRSRGDRHFEIMATNAWGPAIVLAGISAWAFFVAEPIAGFFSLSSAFCLFCCATLGNPDKTSY